MTLSLFIRMAVILFPFLPTLHIVPWDTSMIVNCRIQICPKYALTPHSQIVFVANSSIYCYYIQVGKFQSFYINLQVRNDQHIDFKTSFLEALFLTSQKVFKRKL